ncbi:hypothetical protein DFH94DRAFT_804399 [Russula ochroleuca]|uniref:Uncharacterized protein n=1 Tax=Russula ochroleuca TaxID=152965 RepID=A0A9P5T658_9AGAM|nr:hypothetical protein DFH94DRAFT_804399 [Russula ochroleuca]
MKEKTEREKQNGKKKHDAPRRASVGDKDRIATPLTPGRDPRPATHARTAKPSQAQSSTSPTIRRTVGRAQLIISVQGSLFSDGLLTPQPRCILTRQTSRAAAEDSERGKPGLRGIEALPRSSCHKRRTSHLLIGAANPVLSEGASEGTVYYTIHKPRSPVRPADTTDHHNLTRNTQADRATPSTMRRRRAVAGGRSLVLSVFDGRTTEIRVTAIPGWAGGGVGVGLKIEETSTIKVDREMRMHFNSAASDVYSTTVLQRSLGKNGISGTRVALRGGSKGAQGAATAYGDDGADGAGDGMIANHAYQPPAGRGTATRDFSHARSAAKRYRNGAAVYTRTHPRLGHWPHALSLFPVSVRLDSVAIMAWPVWQAGRQAGK